MDQQEAWTGVLLASLRAENTLLWEVVRAVATAQTTYDDDIGNTYCLFCSGELDLAIAARMYKQAFDHLDDSEKDWSLGPEAFKHTPECIVTQARALVEQAKTGKEHE